MFKEHEHIVFTGKVTGDESENLKSGDVGIVVNVQRRGEPYGVGSLTLAGYAAGIATILPSQARQVTGKDITHARRVETPA